MKDYTPLLQAAVRRFWATRGRQARNQGRKTGQKDAGARSAVTGGAQMDGFLALVRELLGEGGVPEPFVYCRRKTELPGFYQPEKQWDLLVVDGRRLIATIELNPDPRVRST